VIRHSGNWRTSGCVAPSSLCISPHIRFLFISPRFRLWPPQGSLSGQTFAFGYPSSLPNWGWTCPLSRTASCVTLDANPGIGTLAERTSKQPGRARHTTIRWTLAQTAAPTRLPDQRHLHVMFELLKRMWGRIVFRMLRFGASETGYEKTMWKGIEIIARPDDSSRIISALEWLQASFPELEAKVCHHISTILTNDVSRSAVFPLVRGIVLQSKFVQRSDIQRVANRLTSASDHVKLCVESKRYRVQMYSRET